MITVHEALDYILNAVTPLGLETVPLVDARGRVLAEEIYAARNIPPRDNSAMDGFALRADDTMDASPEQPVILDIIENIPAGHLPLKRVERGQAARIMTGAVIPDGADTVAKVEDTESDENKVRLFTAHEKGLNVREKGEDVSDGEHILSPGKSIRPAEMGMLASLGHAQVRVYQRPRVAIIATGDELVDIDREPGPGRIVSSNSYSLYGQVLECGGIPVNLGIARDTREDLETHFRAALQADIIISSGGVSVGDYDFVKDVMKEIGTEIRFWRVAQRPGKPLAFGSMGGKPVFGLPGNPVSSMICFEQYVRPALGKMMGRTGLFRTTVRARLTEDIEKNAGLRYFFRARVALEKDGYIVTTTGSQGSGILKSMVRANGIIVVPEDLKHVAAGEYVTVQLLDETLAFRDKPEYL